MTSIEISYKKVRDGYPLRLWKATTEIDAEPDAIMRRIVYERYVKERTHFAGVLCSHAWVYLACYRVQFALDSMLKELEL